MEAEVVAERKAHEPVGGEVAEHGSAGVTGAAESAGGDTLYAVEELECGAGHEKDGGAVDDRFVGGVNAGNDVREDEEDGAHGGHEGGAEKDGGIARVACVDGRAATEGLANSDSCGGREAERNHVGEGDGVQGDLVTSLGHGAESSDEGSDQGEDADFGGDLNCRGKAEGDELADTREIGLEGSVEELRFVAGVVPEEIEDEDQGQIAAGDARGDARASDAVSVETELAEDEDVVADEVDDIGSDEGEGDGANHVHALQGATDCEVEKEGDESGGKSAHVGRCKDGDGVGDAEAFVIVGENPYRDGEKGSDGEAEVDAIEERGVAVFAMTCAERLGDEGVQADKDAFAKESEDDEQAGGDADGTNGFGAVREAADHHSVDDDHAHPADFGEDERESETKGGAELVAEDRHEGHRVEGRRYQISVVRYQEADGAERQGTGDREPGGD